MSICKSCALFRLCITFSYVLMRLTFVYDPICVPLFAFYDDSEDIVPLSPGTSSYVHLSACVSSTFH